MIGISPKIVLVTTTFSQSKNDLRAQLALKTIGEAKKAGYAIIVVDGSPDDGFKKELSDAGAVVIPEKEKGMGKSRRQCIQAGIDAGANTLAWLEPEKYPMVSLFKPLFEMLETDVPHIIIPRRKDLDGYPPYQHFSELRLNHALGNITGRPDWDLPIGPRVFNKSAAKYFLDYKGERGDQWESIFIPVFRAYRDGVRVDSCLVDYIHPPEQTAAELEDENMNHKRDVQREDLIKAMMDEVSQDKKN